MTRILLGLSAALAATFSSLPARGEVFVLTNNGRVEGEWINKSESPRKKYVIRTRTGGTITLSRAQVSRVVTKSPGQVQYDQIRARYQDTAGSQWELAEWCREHNLIAERKQHLQRVIELEADHALARRALGYILVEGQWKTQAERMTERGFVRFKGRWRLPEEVKLMQQRREQELAEKVWFRDLKRWLGWLDSSKAEQAVDRISEINDVSAVKGLAHFLEEDRGEEVKILLVDVLAGIGSPAAIDVLGKTSLFDQYNEVRLTCLDHLKTEPRPAIVKLYVQSMSKRNQNNAMINRAAVGLKEMNDPSAIRPLIDALVTTHKTKITSGSPGGIGAGFGGPGGGGGLSVGGRTKVLVQHRRNPDVLEALVVLTKAPGFGYDTNAWKHWLNTKEPAARLDARRD